MKPDWRTWPSVIIIIAVVWLVYLSIEVAKHVHAWPFS